MKKVYIPNFILSEKLKTNDGASMFFMDLFKMIQENKTGFKVIFYSLEKILKGDFTDFRKIDNSNLVLSTGGPFGYVIHYFREISGINFRIIRDIHGALWSGYLLQEYLSCPLTRSNDIVIFPSEYCRNLYTNIFTSYLSNQNTIVLHPHSIFQNNNIYKRVNTKLNKIGIIGRISKDKNIFDAVNSFIIFLKEINNTAELHIIGGPYDASLSEIEEIFNMSCVPLDKLVYHGSKLPEKQIHEFYKQIDILLFLSTSNVEALGRVILEAGHFRVPVVAARHAATIELLYPEALVEVNYFHDNFNCHDGFQLGELSITEIVKKMQYVFNNNILPNVNNYINDFQIFLDILTNKRTKFKERSKYDNLLIDNLMIDFPNFISRTESTEIVSFILNTLKSWLNGKNKKKIEKLLLTNTTQKERTKLFINKVENDNIHYSDLGLLPFQISSLINFNPSFTIINNLRKLK